MVKKTMGKRQLNFFKKLIEEKVLELREHVKFLEESFSEESSELTQSHQTGDSASMNIDIDQSFRLVSREGIFLKHLEEALLRIEQGYYGKCQVCKELITEERLKVVPVAKMCVSCKQALEVEVL